MSYVIATMKKLKINDLRSTQIDLDRLYSSEDVVPGEVEAERSNLNLELMSFRDKQLGSLFGDVTTYISQNKVTAKKVRKDAVVLNAWVVTSDRQFFAELDREKIILFFENVVQFFSNRYGEKNIRYATIHLDEKIPHLHLGIVPMINGRLSSKTLITPVELQKLHRELPDYLKSKGWVLTGGSAADEQAVISKQDLAELNELRTEKSTIIQLAQDVKQKSLDIIEIEDSRVRVSDKLYRIHLDQSDDKRKFVEVYGDSAAVISTAQGRRQLGDWVSERKLWDMAVNLLKRRSNSLIEDSKNRDRVLDEKVNITYLMSVLADVAIGLGVEKAQRQQIIEDGLVTINSGLETYNVPLQEVLPNLIAEASEQQLLENVNRFRPY